MADQATDTASAALLKPFNCAICGAFCRRADAGTCKRCGNSWDVGADVAKVREWFARRDVIMGSGLPTKECGATDYPVWGDGSHDTVTCSRPAGHEGPHTGLIGAHQWTW